MNSRLFLSLASLALVAGFAGNAGAAQAGAKSVNGEPSRKLAAELGIRSVTYPGARAPAGHDESTPALVRENGKCVKCRRCVSVCNYVQGVGALFPQGRGFATVIGPAFARPLDGVALDVIDARQPPC